jgi:hypothetical protein
MSKYGQPMSQTLAQMQMNELKMNDPKLNKIFDKLKKGDTVKIKHSSTLERGKDFIEYIVKSKNVVNKGRVEKITLARKDSPTSVKKFLYRRDGKVTFAVGDMAASIDDIREKYSLINHEIIEDIEVEELDEGMAYKFAAVDKKGLVIGFASKESDAKDMARREKGRVVTLTKPLPDNKKSDLMINRPLPDGMDKFPTNTSATQGKRMEEVEEAIDPADLDLDATDADKKAADKNIIMQMRKAMDVRGNMPIEFANGKKEKVDAKILDMMTKAHMKIQKPRDKEKFVAMISKSKRDMLNVAKKLATLKMDLDKSDEPTIKKVIGMLKKASGAHAGQAKDLEKTLVDEKFQSRRPSSKEVKMAIGIANDPRYKQGNMTGAVKAIEKIRDGLSKYPEVADALRKANENLEEGKMKDLLIKGQDLEAYAKKHGGIDKKDMMKVAAMLKKGDKSGALKYAKGMDTDPRDYILDLMGEEVELTEKVSKELALAALSMNQKFVKVAGDFVPEIYLSASDRDKLKKEFGRLPRGFPNQSTGMTVVSMINYALGNKDGRDPYDTEDGDSKSPKLFDYRTMKVVGKPKTVGDAARMAGLRLESVELDEKYDLYHKTFSDAMQHAYDYAKKKLGITVDPKEIDNKVATGPKKPSEGKTNKYRLKGKGGNLQIQVYNKGGSKPFELNMYKEENDMTKSLKDTILEMRKEGFASDAQRKAAFASGYKEKGKKKDEGNAFGAALQAAKENGEDTFVVAGKTYKVKDEEKKLDKVNPDAVKKKFDDRKDKDIDNDGDVDSTDKYLHKRRKAISKAVKSEEVEFKRYHETKQGSLRDAVLKMWGENVQEYVQSDGIKRRVKEGDNRLKSNKTLTKEKKDGNVKKMTDTGKEVTPVETSVKMPKIKETNNKV